MRRLLAIVILALALAACGGTEEEQPAETETVDAGTDSSDSADPTSGPLEAAQAWVDAYAAVDGEAACALQTPEYIEADLASAVEQEIVEEGATCEEGVVAVEEFVEAFGLDYSSVTVELLDESADTATVSITFEGADSSEVELVKRDGAWLIHRDI